MPDIKTKRELSRDAEILATSFSCVRYNGVTYIPTDYETGDDTVTPEEERRIWTPLTQTEIQRKAKSQFGTLFLTESELSSFEFMVAQCCIQHMEQVTSLLIKTEDGLRELREDGKLYLPTGSFVPNTLKPQLNTDPTDKAEMLRILSEWLDSEEEALALLRHLATALAPHWSAIKYVLLLGDGRNGKSVLLSMLQKLFGTENCSQVTRQEISEKSPVVTELNGKLLNLVYDGMALYLKDSGQEKSLIAGEPVGVRRLYASQLTTVQTNALFLEGLNKEPKSSDKSSALQARIVRFWFPNTYEDDLGFQEKMLSERYLGALLSLLIDNYVKKQDKAVMLAPTKASLRLRLEHMYTNSLALQFLYYKELTDPLGAESVIDLTAPELLSQFTSWRVKEGDIGSWSEPDVVELFRPIAVMDRISKRFGSQVRKVRTVVEFKKDTLAFLEGMKEETHDVVGE